MSGSSGKVRTVRINDQGQVVIPEDIRKNLRIEGDTILVLVERRGEIILRREADILRDLEDVWGQLRRRSMERAWEEDDEIWQGIHDREA